MPALLQIVRHIGFSTLQLDLDLDRLSFVHALEVVRDAVAEFQMVETAQVVALYARMLADIATKRLPERRPRSNPRVAIESSAMPK